MLVEYLGVSKLRQEGYTGHWLIEPGRGRRYHGAMSPQSKSDLAREHFTRAHGAFEAGDLVVGVTFLYLAAEAAIVALSELNGIATERQHWRKAQAATELQTRGVLATDLSPVLELLNQARKDVAYEGEDPDFGSWSSEDLLSAIEEVVSRAEEEAGT
jgi:hypothetical protein